MNQPAEKKQPNIVDSHRNMLMVSKNLSDFQLENMKKWAFIFLHNVSTVSINWNFTKGDEFHSGEVSYDIEMGLDQDKDIGFMYLEASTKLMFWADTVVKIKVNGVPWKNQAMLLNTKKTSEKKKIKSSKNSSKAAAPV